MGVTTGYTVQWLALRFLKFRMGSRQVLWTMSILKDLIISTI